MSLSPALVHRGIVAGVVSVDLLAELLDPPPPRQLIDWPTVDTELIVRSCASGAPVARIRRVVVDCAGRELPPPPRGRNQP